MPASPRHGPATIDVGNASATVPTLELALTRALDSVDDGFAIYDAEDRLVYWNSGYSRLWGGLEDSLVPGISFRELAQVVAGRKIVDTGGLSVDGWVESRVALHLGGAGPYEQRLADGRWLLAEERRIESGGVLSIRRDITEQKAAQEALRESEARFRAVVEGSIQGIVVHRDFSILFANQAMAEIFGYGSPEELVRMGSLLGLFAPEDHSRITRHKDARMKGEPAPAVYEMTGLRKDGTRIQIESRVTVFTWDGEPAILGTALDVTRRREAERSRLQSEELFRAIFENTPAAVHLKGLDGRVQLVNKLFEEWYGCSQEEAAGKRASEIVAAGAAAVFMEQDEEVRRTDGVSSRAVDVPFADGSLHTVINRKFPVRGPDGGTIGIATIATDISEQKRAELALRQSEERLRTLIDNIPLPISLKAPDGRYLMVNRTFAQHRGRSPESMIGKTAADMLGPGRVGFVDDLDKKALNERSVVNSELEITGTDGLTRHFISFKFPFLDPAGVPHMIGTVAIDITDRKRTELALQASEARLRTVLENSPIPVSLKGPDGRYVMVNEAFRQRRGVSLGDIIGKTAADIWGPELGKPFDEFDEHVLSTGETSQREIPVLGADGKMRHYLHIKFPFFDADGLPHMIGTMSVDISERKHTEELLLQSKEAADLANRAKTEFLANMSHELRTPLNSIIGFSDLLRSETFGSLGNPRYREYARHINASGMLLLELISDILDVSKIEAGELQLEDVPVDLRALIRDCRSMVAERARRAKVTLTSSVPRSLARLRADPLRLKQVLLNLVTNAIKFTPEGGHVRISAAHRPGGGVTISVGDSGIGIAPEDLPHVIEPFFQVARPETRQREGTGLGLTLANHLVRLHGGELTVESTIDVGTTVTIVLPANRVLG